MIRNRGTQIIKKGSVVKGKMNEPEIAPIYLTTAFHGKDLDDLEKYYSEKGYTYNRIRNPNRDALAELVTYLENGEDSMICSSGMAAISTIFLSMLAVGDHVVANNNLYGETLDLLKSLKRYGIETTVVDFNNLEELESAVRNETKVIYTETISNPLMTIVDIEAVSNIAHRNNARLIVDNTFATSLMFRPLDFGADVSINSLTKFANGHSDVVGGAATSSKELIGKAKSLQALLGCTMDSFSSFLCQRGIRTMDLRVKRQMDNANALAGVLDRNPNVLGVNYPNLEGHPQHELAKRIFENGYGAMLSFELPEDRDKVNRFMQELDIVKYAMTLGGYSTTLSYPVLSSHFQFTKEERLKMGISDGLMRVSVGIEDIEDLINDFTKALRVFE
ncbi:cystathionine beta-lyase [Dethiosulfatibacter aminovorans DSM 17477]|uniref:homocysteine desulfhydrase n=1 Tax=Dethiosulfatibacter aminovorans DSM 17477 TaxID=1121476 RepID=A0A1M6A887_9FIRM|nr:aminotransferase class I/II-fold pyridoxal phosphate-dependent enzyme [Dethiosulfatibacter aminovorans]SHI32660.1 cystathionine beta-lyase [Dethiosulfatibacter aminovorans DSM 17477]